MSPTQKKILAAFETHVQAHDEAPTLSELGGEVGIASRGTMHRHVTELIAAGFLEKSPRHWRGLRLVQTTNSGAATLPLVGRIAAGQPIEAITNYDEIDLGQLLCKPGRYVLQVMGESMKDMGLMDGDYVIIEQQHHASNGQVVVALINDEATLKRYYNRDDGTIDLVAENQAVPKMTFPANEVTIQGVLAGQLRVY